MYTLVIGFVMQTGMLPIANVVVIPGFQTKELCESAGKQLAEKKFSKEFSCLQMRKS